MTQRIKNNDILEIYKLYSLSIHYQLKNSFVFQNDYVNNST